MINLNTRPCLKILLIFLILWVYLPVQAAEFFVDSSEDQVDNNLNDNLCEAMLSNGVKACTLRAAVQQANANAEEDTIILQNETYFLLGPGKEDKSVSGDLDFNTKVTILGAGAQVTFIRGGGQDRIIHNLEGGDLTLIDLTITNGIVINESGAGIANEKGYLKIENCGILENFNLVPPNLAKSGGGIYNLEGKIILNNSLVAKNEAKNKLGGGIFNFFGEIEINNSTITMNIADQEGGGVSNQAGSGFIRNSTIAFNEVLFGNRGGLFSDEYNFFINNTIIANNKGEGAQNDCGDSSFTLEGYNLIGNGQGCRYANANETDQIGSILEPIDPQLGPLQDNGGPTLTHALLGNSPAIDRGDPDNCPSTDQRGVARPQGEGCDIGAYEAECGNGLEQGREECDDGNTVDGDGCSSICELESSGGEGVDDSQDNPGGCNLNKTTDRTHKSLWTVFFFTLGFLILKGRRKRPYNI